MNQDMSVLTVLPILTLVAGLALGLVAGYTWAMILVRSRLLARGEDVQRLRMHVILAAALYTSSQWAADSPGLINQAWPPSSDATEEPPF